MHGLYMVGGFRQSEVEPRLDVSDSSLLRIELLGGFRIVAGGFELPEEGWNLRNAVKLVKRLALAPDYAVLREHLIDLLWPEADLESGANSLRQTLHVARRQLRELPLDPRLILQHRGERVQLYPVEKTLTDRQVFEQAARLAAKDNVPHAYWSAIKHYAGPLLPSDLYEDWTIPDRNELAATYHALLDKVAQIHDERGEHDQAVSALTRLISDEPLHERAHVRLMRIYAMTGQRPLALRQYRRLVDALAQSLDIGPEPETQQLYQDIKEGCFPAESSPSRAAVHPVRTVPRRTIIPSALTSFVGREHEIEQLTQLLRQHRLITLSGAGGVGKTRLAREIAHATELSFPDGVWFVDLAPISDPAQIAGSIASTLRIREDAAVSLENSLVEFLCDRRVLVILDNCEQITAGCADLAQWLVEECPNLHLVVTSRSRLGLPGELLWRVAPLAVPNDVTPSTIDSLALVPSVRLFIERTRLVRPEFALTASNAEDVAIICRRLDGLPLAIELAAALTGTQSLAELNARLNDSLAVLVGSRHLPERHRALRSTLEWSEQLLTPSEQRLFRRFSVFTGACSSEAVKAIYADGIDRGEDVLDLLSGLVDKSLIVADVQGMESRYRMLEPVRQYAAQRLTALDETILTQQRHATYFLTLAESAEIHLTGKEQRAWLDRLDAEDEHLRTALAWLVDCEDYERALRLAASLWRYWYQRGLLRHGANILVNLVERRLSIDPATRAKAFLGSGAFLFRVGGLARARSLLEESLSLYRSLDDVNGAGWATAFLGHVVGALHEDDLALACAEESLGLFRQTNDLSGMARALNALGEVARAKGDDDRAAKLYEEALEVDRAIGDEIGVAMRLHNIGYVDLHRGKFEQATARFVEAFTLRQEHDDSSMLAICTQGLAVTASASGRARTAALLFGAAESLREQSGLTIDVADLPDHERFSANARATLGAETFDVLHARGRLLSPEQILDLARRGLQTPESSPLDSAATSTQTDTSKQPGRQKDDVEIAETTRLGRVERRDSRGVDQLGD